MAVQSLQQNTAPALQKYNLILSQALQWIVFGYQAAALLLFFLTIYFALPWMQRPFIGAFYEHTLVFNGTGSADGSREWDLYRKVSVGEQMTAVNGISIRSDDHMRAVLQQRIPGETITITVRGLDGAERNIDVVVNHFPDSAEFTYFYIPMLLSAIFLAASFWIFGLRRNEPAGRAFSLFTSSLAIVTGTYFNLITSHQFTAAWVLGLAVTGGALINLGLTFPYEAKVVITYPFLRWVGIYVSIGLFIYGYPALYNFEDPTVYISRWQVIYAFLAVSILLYILINIYQATYAQSPVIKTQARTILIGTVVAFSPVSIWLILGAIFPLNFSPYLFFPLAIFPAAIGYTILRFRFLRADDFARRGVMYLVLSLMVALGYAALTAGVALIFTNILNNEAIVFVNAVIFLAIALMLDPLRTRLQGFVDAVFFRGERAAAEQLEEFTHRLTNSLDLASIGTLLREQIASTLAPGRIHIYTYDSLNDLFSALPGPDRRPTSDIRFTVTSPLVKYFQGEKIPLYLDNSASLPPLLQSEQSRLALLGARLFIALPGKERPNGWLALGARLSGQAYSPRDLRFLENMCEQASVAIERVQNVVNLERRVQEMNALTRVSQGVNITLTFDDVLELIYAQTAQIIPVTHFHITLYNKSSDYYYYGFCVESNERIPARENLPFSAETDLSPEVMRKGRTIITQDYIRECQARNVTPVLNNVFAWMGVPLNAGAESLGTLSISSRDGSVTYTKGQLELLQAIADQTAGAIIKARLLQESQQRAHQLSTLNEITRQLTGTLELEPLLQNILENAVGILNCEAGSLFLLDEQTDELVFKVTVGPVAANLVGQRLAPGTGIVGRAVQTRRPVIQNEEQRTLTHFNAIDQQTGFVSRSFLAVPLQVKDRVTGVIEVINRRDGLPFLEDDQLLLTAFAGQAAVAIENARLYTLTDQELAARVEELSVMQRIDRELNASLEMDRAMRITLDWALRQSGAEAGLIGVLNDGKLIVMAQQGFDDQLPDIATQPLKIEIGAMLEAVETSQPQRRSVAQSSEKLMPTAHTQIVIPIRREVNVIGLLHIESVSDSLLDVEFLTRLTDHASIAISNAQLYGEVQRANLAKSEFVSFVAHELKNPMTSIKGYTDLMSAGAVGAISDMQANFLNTIKTNVIRMDTLVSDLNDISKIEAGRLSLTYKATEVPGLIDDTVRSLKKQIQDKKQTLELVVPENLSNIWADRVRVVQVLVNLLSNSHKYTPEGGTLQLGAEESTNHWDPDGAPKVVHIWIKDNGVGMTPEDQKKIFQQYFRTEYSKDMATGTGLGLNITKRLVEMQGGKIWFESEFQKGTTFHFTMPVSEE